MSDRATGDDVAATTAAQTPGPTVDAVQDVGAVEPIVQKEQNLVLDELSDRLHAFRTLSHTDDESAIDAVLGEFGAKGKVEQDIIRELSARKPLWLPARFDEAHHLVMRSLEVLDRNGARSANMPKLGPLTPVASYLVQVVAQFIVRNHQSQVITSVRNLYVRREASADRDVPERFMLRRARIDAERVMPTLKKNPLGVPTFLLGGAVVSWVSTALGQAVEGAKSKTGFIIAMCVLFAAFGGLSWVVLRGAAVARHRIRISLDTPLHALWETIGACGNPPKDSAKEFALIAVLLTVVGFVVIPIVLLATVFR